MLQNGSSRDGPAPEVIKQIILDTFYEVNTALFGSSIDIVFSGSTCVVVLVVKSHVYVANVGDS